MDFDLTEEQRLLRDSVDRLLADHYAFDKRKAYLAEPEGWSRALWAQYAELGLLGLPFAEEHGGFGGGGIEIMLIMEAFGRTLALEPYLATVVLAGTALRLFQDQNGTEFNLLMAAALVHIVPVVLLFFVAQRYFVKGIAMSGLKG